MCISWNKVQTRARKALEIQSTKTIFVQALTTPWNKVQTRARKAPKIQSTKNIFVQTLTLTLARSKPKKIKWTAGTGMKQTTLRSSLTNHILSAKASLSNKFLNYVICKKLPRFFHIFTDPKNSERFCLPPTHSFDLFPLTLFFVFVFIIQTFFVCPKFINRLKPTLFCRT